MTRTQPFSISQEKRYNSRLEDARTVAVEAFAAVRDDRVLLEAEPVWSVTDPNDVLYFECLARIQAASGERLSPASFIPQLEQAGLISVLDGHIVNLVLKQLRAYPELCFGVNLSATSAVMDAFWELKFAEFAQAPDLSRRLFIEITETAALDPQQGRLFVNRLRHCGCRVVIDDFGVGYGLQTAMLIKFPDVIKIDRSVLAGIRNRHYSQALLRKLVIAASRWAPQVVIEGVESEADLTIVREAGAGWAQGFHRKTHQSFGGGHARAL